jgi:anthranilate phosphoribosyltransferase
LIVIIVLKGGNLMDEQLLRSFGQVVNSLMARKNLTRKEAREMFCEILAGNQPDIHQGAALAALRMKGETAEEIAGCFEAIYELDTNKGSINGLQVVENCGTGMDSLKTFNISTISSIVAASLGVYLARHGARAITSRCGTVDLCEALGVDVECDVNMVCRSIETCGIGLFNGMSSRVHPGGLGRILSQIRFASTFNIAASLANPVLPRIGVRGVGSPEQIEPALDVMSRIGYRKAIVFHGLEQDGDKGMDELSTLGISRLGILEENGGIEFQEIRPEDVGLPHGDYEEIRPRDSVEDEAVDAVKTLAGRGNRSRTEIVALNTGVILWTVGKTLSLREGVDIAMEKIMSGTPLTKLLDWVRAQNRNPEGGLEKLMVLSAKGGISL